MGGRKLWPYQARAKDALSPPTPNSSFKLHDIVFAKWLIVRHKFCQQPMFCPLSYCLFSVFEVAYSSFTSFNTLQPPHNLQANLPKSLNCAWIFVPIVKAGMTRVFAIALWAREVQGSGYRSARLMLNVVKIVLHPSKLFFRFSLLTSQKVQFQL